jgi:hypothetical protein
LTAFLFAEAIDYMLEHKFDTLSRVPNITAPLLFVHSNDDFDIPADHSHRLYDALLEPHLPPMPYDAHDIRARNVPYAQMMDAIRSANTERACVREQLETVRDLGNVGTVRSFVRPQSHGGRSATFFEANFGGHNRIIVHETVMDVVRDTVDL